MKALTVNANVHSWIKAFFIVSIILAAFFFFQTAFASDGGGGGGGCGSANSGSLGEVADNITNSFGSVTKLITGMSFVAGFGFVLGSIFKFKAHKDNPTQIPVGTPIALLFIGAAMIFLPQMLNVTGMTMFNSSSAQTGTITGTCDFGFGQQSQ